MAAIFIIDGVESPRQRLLYIPRIGEGVTIKSGGSLKICSVESVEHFVNKGDARGIVDTFITLKTIGDSSIKKEVESKKGAV